MYRELQAAARTLRFILRHPLNRRRPLSALLGFARWQLGSRLVPGAVAVPWIEKTRLLTTPGMTGATGNVYCGLHEFEDMGLILHALRPDDLFVDVGANVGSYTVLAAGVCGAKVIAIEPSPSTFARLLENIRLNDLASLVTAKNLALGAAAGVLRLTQDLDAVNRVLATGEGAGVGCEVPAQALDSILGGKPPLILKIDVEGYETEVLKGAQRTLGSADLQAIVIELNGSGARYGFDEAELHRGLVARGFRPCRYDAFTRVFSRLPAKNPAADNTLYARDAAYLTERVRAAPR